MHTEQLKLYTLRGPGVFSSTFYFILNLETSRIAQAVSSKFQAMTVCEPVVAEVVAHRISRLITQGPLRQSMPCKLG